MKCYISILDKSVKHSKPYNGPILCIRKLKLADPIGEDRAEVWAAYIPKTHLLGRQHMQTSRSLLSPAGSRSVLGREK